MVRLVVHLLDPARPEASAAFVGKLIIVFIKKVSEMCLERGRDDGCVRQGQCWGTTCSCCCDLS